MLLGFVAALFQKHPDESRRAWYLLFGTGFCGGFTTFSTFSLEMLRLIQQERWGTVAAYVLSSIVASVFGVWLAIRIVGERT